MATGWKTGKEGKKKKIERNGSNFLCLVRNDLTIGLIGF